MDVADLVKEFSNLKHLNEYGLDKNAENLWKERTKTLYDYIKSEEKALGFPSSFKAIDKLYTTNMTSEQIWQQLELQNKCLIPEYNSLNLMNDASLCVMVARLSTQINEEENEEEEEESHDEGLGTGGEESSAGSDANEDEEQENDGNTKSSSTKKSTLEDQEDANEGLSDFGDLDADTFGDIAQEDDDDDDNDEDSDNDGLLSDANDSDQGGKYSDDEDYNNGELSEERINEKSQKHKRKKIKKKFKSTEADSQFLSVRESEWVADEDLIGENNDFEHIDIMQEHIGDSDEDENKVMYDDFFDPPEGQKDATNDEGVSSEDDDDGTDSPEPEDAETEKYPEAETRDTEARGTLINRILPKSSFEVAMSYQQSVQEDLEENMLVGEKPWFLKGEVTKENRPENSTLEENLEHVVATRQKPIITEETTANVEKLILSRVRNQAWDDVERKIKPKLDPFNYKQKLILDQEKSKKSLATLYEEEFVKKSAESEGGPSETVRSILGESDEKFEELPVHTEIRDGMDDLFKKLDALSHFHYTPKQKDAEIRVVSNLPSISIEEATPTAVSDAALLAPQEIVAPTKGDAKGESEKTFTDKRRQRRVKKSIQKAKAHRQEAKLRDQIKISKKKGTLLKNETSVQLVHKAYKKGQIKALEKDGGTSTKSSSAFFKQMQNNLSDIKKRKMEADSITNKKKRKEKDKNSSLNKLLL